MARRIKERKLKSPNITIIGEGLTERCYFKHLKSLKGYRYTCKPRNFSQQSIDDLQKQIDKVLEDDGVAVCVFDADVARDKPAERKKLEAMQKKYAGKEADKDAMMAKSQEMLMIYKKYGINPMSSCLSAFTQLPIFFALLEAIYRVPVFFEKKFLVYNLGTTPAEGLLAHNYWYIILIVLIIGTTYFSFKNNLIVKLLVLILLGLSK